MISAARVAVAAVGTAIFVIACSSTPASQPIPAAQATPTATPLSEPAPSPEAIPTSTPPTQPTPSPEATPTSTPPTQPTPSPEATPTSTPPTQPTPSPEATPTSTPPTRPSPIARATRTFSFLSRSTPTPETPTAADEVSEPADDTTEDGPVVVHLSVEPVSDKPLTVRFAAEIVGGSDNSKDLYCKGETWEFGDGRGDRSFTECLVWSPTSKFTRQHQQTYTYEKPGTYKASFAYGPLSPVTVSVDVQYPPLADADPGDGMTPVRAPIDGVRLEVTESVPPEYFVVVQSGLPNGCARFEGYAVDRDHRNIMVHVTNLVLEDKDRVCTQVYGTVESRVPLGSYFEQGTFYTVYVNDVTHPFRAKRGRPTEAGPGSTPDLDRPFELSVGESAFFQAEGLDVLFEAVAEDSRCPANANCVSAGQAIVAIAIFDSRGRSVGNLELTLGGILEHSFENIGGYSVAFRSLDPYPGTPEAIAHGENVVYTATLLVSGAVEDVPQQDGPAVAHLSVEPVEGVESQEVV